MIKLDRHKIIWILLVVTLGFLFGSLLIYSSNKNRPDPYDQDILKGLGHTVQSASGENNQETDEFDEIKAQIPADSLKNGVYAGKPYSETLVAEGSRNVLILGEDKVNKLYDTIGVASIDSKTKTLSMVMFPRDTYIEYTENIMDAIAAAGKLKIAGFYKLNNAHFVGALAGYKGKFSAGSISFLAEVIKEKFGIDIDDYIKVKTEGLVEAVDLFGGIDINVPYDMNYDDPVQELHIHLFKGQQHLDGMQAEGFVRFRQGYREDGTLLQIGDIERKKNQITFIKEFIRQHGTIANINKIPKFLSTLNKNIKQSIGFGDMLLTYTGIARDVINEKYVIKSRLLDGSEKYINGSAYIIID